MSDTHYIQLAAEAAKAKLPDNYGILLFAVPLTGGDNRLRYCSSIPREQAIQVVKEWLYHNGVKENWVKHIE